MHISFLVQQHLQPALQILSLSAPLYLIFLLPWFPSTLSCLFSSTEEFFCDLLWCLNKYKNLGVTESQAGVLSPSLKSSVASIR